MTPYCHRRVGPTILLLTAVAQQHREKLGLPGQTASRGITPYLFYMIQQTLALVKAFWEKIQPWCSSAAIWAGRATTYPIRWITFLFARLVRFCATFVPILILAVVI